MDSQMAVIFRTSAERFGPPSLVSEVLDFKGRDIMSERNTVVRSLHDLGLAAWFGGSLMGATGLNGAASAAVRPQERLKLSSVGWAKWTPWQLAAIVTHSIGGIGLIAANRSRLRNQPSASSATVAKLVLTVAAAGTTAYSGVLGAQVKKHEVDGADGATEPSPTSSRELAGAQKQLKILQWATPLLTGAALVLGAVQGEQQRGPAGLLDFNARDAGQAIARKLSKAS
jgi:hypothetical protein